MTKRQGWVAIVLLGAILIFHIVSAAIPPVVEPQWEYRVEDIPDENLVNKLDSMGYGRWQIVFARRAMDEDTHKPSYEVILRRAK